MLIGNDVKLNSPSSLIGQALAEILQYPDRARDALRVLLHLVRHGHAHTKEMPQPKTHKNTDAAPPGCCRWRNLFRGYRMASVTPCIHPSKVWRTRWGASLAGRPCWQLWASVLTLLALVSPLLSSFLLLIQGTGSNSAAPLYNHYWVCTCDKLYITVLLESEPLLPYCPVFYGFGGLVFYVILLTLFFTYKPSP